MGVITLALAGAAAVYVHKQRKENKERRRKADDANQSLADAVRKGESPFQEDFRYATLPQLLSMLVDGVYYRDHKAIDFDFPVKPYLEGEYEVDMRMVHYTSELYWDRIASISEEEEKDVGLKHYVRKANHPNRLAPSLVIAIRGTKLSSGRDIVDDILILMQILDLSSRYKKLGELVKKIIMEFRTLQQQGYNHGYRRAAAPAQHLDVRCDECYMAPITGTRYKSKKFYNCDLCQSCFRAYGAYSDYTKIDLPGSYPEPESSRRRDACVQHQGVRCVFCNMSPIIGTRYKSKFYDNDLCQTCFQANGAINDYIRIDGDIYITGHSLGAAMALQIGKYLAAEENQWYDVHCFNPPFLTVIYLIQKSFLVGKFKDVLRNSPLGSLVEAASHVKDFTKMAAVMVFGDRQQLMLEMFHFASLWDWIPVLYVNPHDHICSRFLKYYKQKHSGSMSPVCSQAMLSRILGHNARYTSLVPSVNMYISKLRKKPHDLKNWYRGPPIDEYQEFRVLPRPWLRALLLGEVIPSFANTIIRSPQTSYNVDDSESDSDSGYGSD